MNVRTKRDLMNIVFTLIVACVVASIIDLATKKTACAQNESYDIRIDVDPSVANQIGQDQILAWVDTTMAWVSSEFEPAGIEFFVQEVRLLTNDHGGAITQKLDAYTVESADYHGFRLLFTTSPLNNPTGAGVASTQGLCGGTPVAVVSIPTAMTIGEANWRAVDLSVHELGHLFGLKHSHCDGIDMCWSGPAPCYVGPTYCPTQPGSVMSLCFNGACAGTLNSTSFDLIHIQQLRDSPCRKLFAADFE